MLRINAKLINEATLFNSCLNVSNKLEMGKMIEIVVNQKREREKERDSATSTNKLNAWG
jgi:hypothetical protein